MGGSSKRKAALAAAPDAMKRPAARSAGQPPKFDNDRRAFHGNLTRLCTDTGQHVAPRDRECGNRLPRAALALTWPQRDFLEKRNASFGRRGYDLRRAMEDRLEKLNTIARQ